MNYEMIIRWTIAAFLGLLLLARLATIGLLYLYEKTVEQYSEKYYNQTITVAAPPEYAYNVASVTFSGGLSLVGAACALKKTNSNHGLKRIMKRLAVEIGAIVGNFVIMFALYQVLAIIVGMPSLHLGLTKQFCMVDGKLSIDLRSHDGEINSLCQEYPSFLCGIMAYWTTFLYLYIEHLTNSKYVRMANIVLFVTMSAICFIVFIKLHNEGELFGVDIFYGTAFGIINACMLIYRMFGNVLPICRPGLSDNSVQLNLRRRG